MTHYVSSTRSPYAGSDPLPTRPDAGSVHPLTPLRSVRQAFLFVIDVVKDANRLRRGLRLQPLVPEA